MAMLKSKWNKEFYYYVIPEDFTTKDVREFEKLLEKEYKNYPESYTDYSCNEVNATALSEWLINDHGLEEDFAADLAFCFSEYQETKLQEEFDQSVW